MNGSRVGWKTMLGLALLVVGLCLGSLNCTLVGCDGVCGKQFSCSEGKTDRAQCLEACQASVVAGNLCQAYFNCWQNKPCDQTASCVDFKALCP